MLRRNYSWIEWWLYLRDRENSRGGNFSLKDAKKAGRSRRFVLKENINAVSKMLEEERQLKYQKILGRQFVASTCLVAWMKTRKLNIWNGAGRLKMFVKGQSRYINNIVEWRHMATLQRCVNQVSKYSKDLWIWGYTCSCQIMRSVKMEMIAVFF